MLSREDLTFRDALERVIRGILAGDDRTPGLYYTLRSSPNWDSFQRAAGGIEAYEAVLKEMIKLARELNGEDRVRGEYERRMN